MNEPHYFSKCEMHEHERAHTRALEWERMCAFNSPDLMGTELSPLYLLFFFTSTAVREICDNPRCLAFKGVQVQFYMSSLEKIVGSHVIGNSIDPIPA